MKTPRLRSAPENNLATETRQRYVETLSHLRPEIRQLVVRSLEKLSASDVAADAKDIGDRAPDFSLPSASGKVVRLSDQLAGGPVVLSFFRGGWCPYCNLELKALQDVLPEIRAMGASLIAVSPEWPDGTLSTVEKHQLEFDVLSDVGNVVARAYGLVFPLSPEIRRLYLDWGINLSEINGDDTWELPVPATYVIEAGGVIHQAFIEKDYTKRMEPAAIVSELARL